MTNLNDDSAVLSIYLYYEHRMVRCLYRLLAAFVLFLLYSIAMESDG